MLDDSRAPAPRSRRQFHRPRSAAVASRLLVPALASLLATCGGGGGGGSGPQRSAPTLLTAVLIENTADGVPQANESLDLFLDDTVTLVPGVVFDGADVTLSSGSLGTITAPPALIDARRVRVTLGAGVSFTPGTTTIALSAAQDAVRSQTTGKIATGGTPITVKVGDGNQPTISALTVNGLPPQLNGFFAGGFIQTPRTGFSIDATVSDATSAIDPNRFQVSSSTNVTVNATTVPAGDNLFPYLMANGTPSTFTFFVPGNVLFPAGATTVTAVAFDVTGMGSAPRTYPFLVVSANDSLRPFETTVNASQVWFLDTTRDIDAISSSGGPTTITLTSTEGANGTSDFIEMLRVIGLQSTASGTDPTNTQALDLLKNEIIEQLRLLFPAVNVTYQFVPPAPFPNALQTNYSSSAYSRMCLGARSSNGALGVAIFDSRNAHQDDDCAHPGSSPSFNIRLGVFPHTLVEDSQGGVNGPTASLFRITFDAFTKGRGTPIGENVADAATLTALANNQPVGAGRPTQIQRAIDRLARFIAVVTAHETGHSMGLVENGAPPTGQYGGDAEHFPGSTSGHIDMSATGLFPPSAQEVMSPAISFDEAQSTSTGFNPLNLAYLRERVLHNGQ